MIRELSLHPMQANKKARVLFLIAILISALGFVTCFVLDKYKDVIATASVMMLATAILFYVKYISPEFYYDIAFDSEGVPVFVVRRIIGKRQTILSRIGLADIVSVVKQSSAEKKTHKTLAGYKTYSYTPTLMPKATYLITVEALYDSAEIRIEGTDEFAELLREYSIEARL